MSHCLNVFALVTNQTKLNICLILVHIFNKRYMYPCNDIKWIISFLQQWKLGVTHLSYFLTPMSALRNRLCIFGQIVYKYY